MADSRLCSMPDCGKRPKARGLCKLHYDQGLKANRLPPKRLTARDWINANLDFDGDECLIWPFYRDTYGYGVLKISSKSTSASRYTCTLAHGEPPSPRHQAGHGCGNGHLGCVNPKHLRWVTPLENQSDKILHGTANNKISDECVLEIRKLRGLASIRELGERFNLHHTTISQIQRGLRRPAIATPEEG